MRSDAMYIGHVRVGLLFPFENLLLCVVYYFIISSHLYNVHDKYWLYSFF